MPIDKIHDNNLESRPDNAADIAFLRSNPNVKADELFSRGSGARIGARARIDGDSVPLSSKFSPGGMTESNLMAVIALGNETAIGVVSVRKIVDRQLEELHYLALLNNDPDENDGRGTLLGVLDPDMPVVLGRDPNSCDFPVSHPTVSRRHVTLEINDGYLMVADEHSTNGTTLFTANGEVGMDFRGWSLPGREEAQLFDDQTTLALGTRAVDRSLIKP